MTLVEGEVDTLFAEALAISPRDARRNKVLACQTTPDQRPGHQADLGRGLPARRPGRQALRRDALTTKDEIGPAIFRLGFTAEHVVPFREGQLRRHRGFHGLFGAATRCPTAGGHIPPSSSPALRRQARQRDRRRALPGDDVVIEMPFGEMWLQDTDAPICLVAGGTSIAPILSRSPRRWHRHLQRSGQGHRGARQGTSQTFIADLRSGLDELQRRVPRNKTTWRNSGRFCFSSGPGMATCWPPVSRDCRRPSRSTDQSRTTRPAATKMLRCLGSTAPSTIGDVDRARRQGGPRRRTGARTRRRGSGADHAFFNDTGQQYNASPPRRRLAAPAGTGSPATWPESHCGRMRAVRAWVVWSAGLLAYIVAVLDRTLGVAGTLDAANRFGAGRRCCPRSWCSNSSSTPRQIRAVHLLDGSARRR